MKKSKNLKLITGVILSVILLSSCGSKTTQTSANSSSPKTIIIGTGNAYKPYCYLDEKGNPVGYEIEVLKAVNKLLPQYKFQFQTMEFKNVLISLGSNKVDLAAHQYEKNPEREQKYLFANESYTNYTQKIVVKKDRNDIKSIDDLVGKTVQASPGSNTAYLLETYNKSHNNGIKIVYSSSDDATTVKSIEDGRIDAAIAIKRTVDSWNKAFGDNLKQVGDPVSTSNTYYIYRKSDTKLRNDIDGALKKLKEDGTLSKISIKVLGGDYTANQ